MIQAQWQGVVIAKSDKTIVIEGNHYFPPADVKSEYLVDSASHSTCPWKGEASYKSLRVGGKALEDAAWYYPEPKSAAAQIKGYFAFWKGVQVG